MNKTCRKCLVIKPRSNEHFYKNKIQDDKLDPVCKTCRRSVITKNRSNKKKTYPNIELYDHDTGFGIYC